MARLSAATASAAGATRGAAYVMMNAIPMLGSLRIDRAGRHDEQYVGAPRGRSLLAAGMFLRHPRFRIVVQTDRQRKQQTLTGLRLTQPTTCATSIMSGRWHATRLTSNAGLTWHHLSRWRCCRWPRRDPGSGSNTVPTNGSAGQIRVMRATARRRGAGAARERADRPVDPAAACPAPTARRPPLPTQPPGQCRPACLRPDRAVGRGAPRSLARAMIGQRRRVPIPRQPRDRRPVLPAEPAPLGPGHGCRTRSARSRATRWGPMRMVTTNLSDLGTLLPADLSDRPRFGADERPATPHILLVIDLRRVAAGNHVIPPDGLHGVTPLDLPARWYELEDASRLRPGTPRATPSTARRRCRHCCCARSRSRRWPTRATWPPQRRSLDGRPRLGGRGGRRGADWRDVYPTDFMDPAGSGNVREFDPQAAWRPRPLARPASAPIGSESGQPVHPRHQGVCTTGHGAARSGDRRDRVRQVGVPAHLVLGLTMTHSPSSSTWSWSILGAARPSPKMSEMPHVSAVITNPPKSSRWSTACRTPCPARWCAAELLREA